MSRSVKAIVVLLAAAGLGWLFPPFHIRSLEQVRAIRAGAQFQPKDFVESFWEDRLMKSFDLAADARRVIETIAGNREQAREQFGRSVGIGGSYFLYVRGSGRVVSANEEIVGLSVLGAGNEADISVPLGLVFGNAVRDATGLLDAGSFPNSQEFNDISARLNEIVESRVLPELRRMAVVGKRVRFVGCVEVTHEEMDLKPLVLVPVFVAAE